MGHQCLLLLGTMLFLATIINCLERRMIQWSSCAPAFYLILHQGRLHTWRTASVNASQLFGEKPLACRCLCARLRLCVLQRVVHFHLWRWMFFFCGFVPIWWISFYFIRVLTIFLESQFFPFKQVLYYIIGVRVSRNLVRICCMYRIPEKTFAPE